MLALALLGSIVAEPNQHCPFSATNSVGRDSVFREWLQANGVDLSGYKFNYEEGKGYGLVTKVARQAGEVCAQAPFKLAMSEESATRSRVGEMVAEAKQEPQFAGGRSQEDTVQLELLELHLIYELIHIDESFYGPYLAIMPSTNSSSSPLYAPWPPTHPASNTWLPDHLRKHLVGSGLSKEVAKQRGVMQMQFSRANRFFFSKYATEFEFDPQSHAHIRRLTGAVDSTDFWALFLWGTRRSVRAHNARLTLLCLLPHL
jgi:hypothetical protein